MKQNFSFIYKLLLLAGDIFALLLAFSLAYILRVSLDPRPIAMPVSAITYITLITTLLPIWLGSFWLLGLYAKRNYQHRPQEAVRLLFGSFFGVLLFVTFDFFSNEAVFPAKLVPIYAAGISFLLLWVVRSLLRNIRLYMLSKGYGVMKILLVGNSQSTYFLSKYLHNNLYSGYKVVGVVANKRNIFEKLQSKQFKSVQTAIEKANPHAIIQTDSEDTAHIYNLAIENHLDYQFIPSHTALFTAKHSVELLGAFPIINVHTTPLVGYGRAIKRATDVIFGSIALTALSPIILAIAISMKISDPRSAILFKQRRLSRFNKTILIFKFRTHDPIYSGLLPEEAFTKMGRPDLLRQYRENGDQLEDDPRETRIGRFMRRTSLDEIPQLFNIIRGDISLVGPRALVPRELENYEFRSLILSVKSGLTGLAQISGRRDISFEERRKLDMYYVQNWSFWLDIKIIFQTVYMVITGRGAR